MTDTSGIVRPVRDRSTSVLGRRACSQRDPAWVPLVYRPKRLTSGFGFSTSARVVLLPGRGDDQLDAQMKWRSIRAIALVRRGDQEEAESLARRAVSLADETDQLDSRAEARVDLAEVLRQVGRHGEAGRELERAILLYHEKGNDAAESNARRLLDRVRH